MLTNKFLTKIIMIFIFIAMFIAIDNSKIKADEMSLTFKKIGAEQDINLKTIQGQNDLYFTVPKNWKIEELKLELFLQYSEQLIDNRSDLKILINNNLVETIKLTKDYSKGSKIDIIIPSYFITEENTLTIIADQHYTEECEDPFHSSLWTIVKNKSNLQFKYTETEPELNLSKYPYPLFDDLSYEKTNINIVKPEFKKLSNESLKALGLVAGDLAKHIYWKKLTTNIIDINDITNKENLIILGTPSENPYIESLNDLSGYKIKDKKLVDKNNKALPDSYGLILLTKNETNPTKTNLIVTGNSSEGVLKAAMALTQKPSNKILDGKIALVKEVIIPEKANYRDWKDWISSENSNLSNKGFFNRTVRTTSAPPINYSLKIMPDMVKDTLQKSYLDLIYSYSANLDPNLSTLEVEINGVSVDSIQLNNPKGEKEKKLKVYLPSDTLTVYNNLIFKFHIYPIKEGRCKFITDKHIWGTIFNDTEFYLPSTIKATLPNLGLLNDGGYPLTEYTDMQNVYFVLPDKINIDNLDALISIIARISKYTANYSGSNFNVIKSSDLTEEIKENNHLVVIGNEKNNSLLKELIPNLSLTVKDNDIKLATKTENYTQVTDITDKGLIEEIISPWNKKMIVLTIFGKDDKGLIKAISLFKEDKKFDNMKDANIAIVSDKSVNTINTIYNETTNEYSWENFYKMYFQLIIIVLGIIIVFILIAKFSKKV